MRHIPRQHRYAQWDGSQQLPLDADAIMSELTEDLIEHGDLRWAMRNLLSRGMEIPQGGYLQGMRDMLKQLRRDSRNLPVIIVSAHGDIPMCVDTMKNGAVDFLEKPYQPSTLLESVRSAIAVDNESWRERQGVAYRPR